MKDITKTKDWKNFIAFIEANQFNWMVQNIILNTVASALYETSQTKNNKTEALTEKEKEQ